MAALDVFVGSFNLAAGTGNQAITGVGFQPKALFFFAPGNNGFNLAHNAIMGGIGYATGPSEQVSVAWWSRNNVDPSNTAHRLDDAAIYQSLEGAAAPPFLSQRADLVSFDADGFTVNVNIAARPDTIPYLALGGDNFEAQAGSVTVTNDGNANSVAGLGFCPDCILFAGTGLTDTSGVIGDDMTGFWGVETGSNRYGASWFRQDNAASQGANTRGGNEQTSFPVMMQDLDGTIELEATIDLVEGGFNINKTTVPAADQRIIYLAIKGMQTSLSSFVADEAEFASKAIAGVGFQPTGGLFFADYLNSPIIGRTGNRFGIGAQGQEDGPVNMEAAATFWHGGDNANPEVQDRTTADEFVAFNANDFNTDLESFHVETWDADGFTIRNVAKETADFPLSEVFYMVFQAGTNDNCAVHVRGTNCISAFALLLSEYGICGTSTFPEASCLGNDCVKLSATPSTTHTIDYDLGLDYLDDFEIADLLIIETLSNYIELEDPITIRVRASDDPLFGVFDENIFVVGAVDLVGGTGRDYATELSLPSKRRYWRVILETTRSIHPILGSIALGKALRLEHSPAFPIKMRLLDANTEARRNPWELQIDFKGIVETQKVLFDERVLTYGDITPIWLYDGNDAVLFGNRVMRTMLMRVVMDLRDSGIDYDLKLRFEELV